MNKYSARATAHYNGTPQRIGSIGEWEGMIGGGADEGEEG